MKCAVLIVEELIKSTLIIMLIYQHTHQYTCNVFAERLPTQKNYGIASNFVTLYFN